MTKVYLGLGSNQDNPQAQLVRAIDALNEIPESHVINVSSLYTSAPVGPQDQPDYINAVALLETGLPAHDLLEHLQSIENSQGRKRIRHWGPRTIDLDILLYGNRVINSTDLVIPHPEMHRRGFVLVPLNEIDPAIQIPGHGSINNLLGKINTENVSLYQKND